MQEYLRKTQEILRLQDWDITLIMMPAMSYDGETKTIYNDQQAVIRIAADLSEGSKKLTILHELLHCVNRDSHDIAYDGVAPKQLNELYNRYHERAIEQTAKALYFLLEGHRYIPQDGE